MAMRFDNVFNMGNVFTGLMTLGALTGIYVDIRVVLTRFDDRIAFLEKQTAAVQSISSAMIAAQTQIVTIQRDIQISSDNSQKTVSALSDIRSDIATIKALYQRGGSH